MQCWSDAKMSLSVDAGTPAEGAEANHSTLPPTERLIFASLQHYIEQGGGTEGGRRRAFMNSPISRVSLISCVRLSFVFHMA